jgi:DNA-binding LacI/PurR family transcriptional regulator
MCLHEKITEDIKKLIVSEKIKYRGQIPSVNEIRKKYDVSHVTVLRVFKNLVNENYIERVNGKGYYAIFRKRPLSQKLHGIVACMTRPFREDNLKDNYFNSINQAIQRTLMAKKFNVFYPSCNLSFADNLPDDSDLSLVKDFGIELVNKVDGFIIDERIPDAIITLIKNKVDRPIVLIGRNSSLDIDSVSPDNFNGASKAAELCVKMKYEYFCVARNALFSSNNAERTDAFIQSLKENNVPPEKIFCFDYNIEPYEKTFSLITENVTKGGKTVIFSPNDPFARWLTDKFDGKGIALGREIGIISFEGLGYSTIRKPHISTVDIHPSEMGKKAVEILLSRIYGTNCKRKQNHTVPTTLQIGATL